MSQIVAQMLPPLRGRAAIAAEGVLRSSLRRGARGSATSLPFSRCTHHHPTAGGHHH